MVRNIIENVFYLKKIVLLYFISMVHKYFFFLIYSIPLLVVILKYPIYQFVSIYLPH